MTAPWLERLAALQRPDGGFESVVATRSGGGVAADVNCFTTACVLRALRGVSDRSLAQLMERALDFLETCAAPSPRGAYSFWPAGSRPAWAAQLPPDVDDTTLALGELLRHGRITRREALRALCLVILPCRVRPNECDSLPKWVVPGCFRTWIAPRAAGLRRAQVVDACVNANVVALMARLDATHLPGYAQACAAIERGLLWAGSERARLASLTPFYPSPREFAEALAHAVECGASELRHAALCAGVWTHEAGAESAACCSSAYGHITWSCAALEEARVIARRVAA